MAGLRDSQGVNAASMMTLRRDEIERCERALLAKVSFMYLINYFSRSLSCNYRVIFHMISRPFLSLFDPH
jgi:hypothetical protein